jgi:Bardet-Biedl syndrome 4 protein
MYLKQYDKAQECFMNANSIQRHDITYIELGKVFTQQENYKDALDIFLEALEYVFQTSLIYSQLFP